MLNYTIKNHFFWSLRLSVRTRGFHPRKRGSIPLGTAKIPKNRMLFYVYLIKTIKGFKNKSYVGYTNNIKSRLSKHNSNKGAKSTKGYKWQLVYKRRFFSKQKALSFEYRLKKDRKERLKIIYDFKKNTKS